MRKSAGILLYHEKDGQIEVFLVHPGGPFWANKDESVWSIPKGEYEDGEEPLQAAIRELEEETGYKVKGPFIALTPIKQKAGKQVVAWAAQGDLDANAIQSNTFRMQWPPNSGKWVIMPEVDKGGWFTPSLAKQKINPAQALFIDELVSYIQLHKFTTNSG